jgi:uncharacterized membrane protein YphA (DoxX/SURF4 family)
MRKFSAVFSRFFVGLLFVFSGLIKANDPLGFGYKLQEYFEVFHITFFNDYATAIAIFLCGLEIILGGALLLGLFARHVIWGLLGLIVFFTFLTFYSAFFEVVTSCGCFGDAIPLTPWQSFGKDLILLAFILILFIYRREIKPLVDRPAMQAALIGPLVLISFGIGVFTYSNLPFIDFLPYKVGANIPALMTIPPGSPQDEYQITYHLKNKQTGAEQDMTDKEYLKQEIWKDVNWEIKGEPESKLIKKGFEPKIKDLKLVDASGQDVTQALLQKPGYQLWLVAYDLNASNREAFSRISTTIIKSAVRNGIPTLILTASSPAAAEELKNELKWNAVFYYADAIPLKSMVRANPGILLMKDGSVVQKWHYRNFPSYQDLAQKYIQQ